MPNHEHAQRRFAHSYKMLVDTYPREYNEFEIGLLSISFVVFLYVNERIVLELL
jgi:hypothetical protein